MNKFLKNKTDITAWLDQYNITNYELISDDKYGYIVDVNRDVDLSVELLNHIPVKFGNVNGDFYCYNNNLTSLEFCPITICGDFDCSDNKLSSLEFCPETIISEFDCSQNNLTNLKYCPKTADGYFNCSDNNLTSLEFCPKTIGGDFDCSDNKLSSLEFCPTTINGYFHCYNNKIADLIHFPSHIGGDIYLGKNKIIRTNIQKNKSYNFAELYPIHLEHKITAQKELLENNIANKAPIKITKQSFKL